MPVQISTSVLSANFCNLQKEIEMINESASDWIHIDVMDGVFVPNISFGFPIIKAIKPITKKPLDVHLMIFEPARYIDQFVDFGADIISVHIEACPHLHRNIQQIRARGVKAGVALNPHTSISQLDNIIGDLDIVCLMSVNPGFGGQQFIQNSYNKILELKQLIKQKNSSAKIQIDGGVNIENSKKLIATGAQILVAGNCIFSSENPKKTIDKLKNQ